MHTIHMLFSSIVLCFDMSQWSCVLTCVKGIVDSIFSSLHSATMPLKKVSECIFQSNLKSREKVIDNNKNTVGYIFMRILFMLTNKV